MVRSLPRAAFLFTLAVALPVAAQDNNIPAPIPMIEQRLRSTAFEIIDMPTSRGFPSERTYAPTVRFEDGALFKVKFAPAPPGGDEFNNRPQYEVAAYEIQRLFLDESEYVVPPTVARCFPFGFVMDAINKAETRQAIADPVPTFEEWGSSVVVLQFWLWNTRHARDSDIRDRDRLEDDELFARYAGNFNLLTYLIRHNDSNYGNFLLSEDPANPRIFSIDNGLAFSQRVRDESDRGNYWRELRIDRFPASSIERLRAVTLEDLQARLGVVAQCQLGPGGFLVQAEPTENLDPGEGIRRSGDVLQIGLTESEIQNVYRRLTDLIEDVDKGRYEVF